jgi:uncharacterized protein (DUF2141 family)
MKTKFFVLTLILFLFIPVGTFTQQTATISVTITGFQSDNGIANIALFNSKNGFPAEVDKAFKKAELSISNKKAKTTFTGIPYGTYAITVLHDENKNGKLDTKLLVIPAEGVGTSNNPKLTGPPSFNQSKFEVNKSELAISIKMMYL